MSKAMNVLGGALEVCGTSPQTGFFRTGCCDSSNDDLGIHVVCAEMTERFLEFSRMAGNDLSTPNPEHGFPGLKPGDRWCLCAARWQEAFDEGFAPPVVLAATNVAALEWVRMTDLRAHALDAPSKSDEKRK